MTHTFPPTAPPQPRKRHTARNVLLIGAAAIVGIIALTPDEPAPSPAPSSPAIMQIVWDGMTISEQAELCEGIDVLGNAAAYRATISEMDDMAFSRSEFDAFFGRVCR